MWAIKSLWNFVFDPFFVGTNYEDVDLFDIVIFTLFLPICIVLDLAFLPVEIIVYIILRVLKKRGEKKK